MDPENINEAMIYKRAWVRILVEILEWPNDAALKWANAHAHSNDPWLSHDSASHYVLPIIFSGGALRNAERSKIEVKAELAIERYLHETRMGPADEQKKDIRSKISLLQKMHSESL